MKHNRNKNKCRNIIMNGEIIKENIWTISRSISKLILNFRASTFDLMIMINLNTMFIYFNKDELI
jgi:hypothetical protein